MPRRAIVEEIRPQDDTSAVVWFEGVDDIDTAKALCGCHVLVRREELPELAQAIAAAHSDGVSGWEVHDAQTGLLGTLLRVEDNPGRAFSSWIVQTATASAHSARGRVFGGNRRGARAHRRRCAGGPFELVAT